MLRSNSVGGERPASNVAQPHYFGPRKQYFGVLNWPRTPVRGAALICPPLGYEAVTSYQTLRVLAESLAEAGVATLRVDYAGTGNSLDSPPPNDPLESFQDTIRAALLELESFGLSQAVVIGMRFGAALAVTATTGKPVVGGYVFWDPLSSGRKYARMMTLMSALGPASDDGSTSIAGVRYSSEMLADIKKVRLPPGSVQQPNLVVLRQSEETDDWSPDIAPGGQTLIVRREGSAEVLDVDAELAVVPRDLVSEVTSWVAGRVDAPHTPPPCPGTLTATTSDAGAGSRLAHDAIRIGGAKLFAVDTASTTAAPRRAVIMLNNGVSPAIGPGRAWVEWSAGLAALDLRVLRLDLDGLGESPARAGSIDQLAYPAGAAADIADAVTYLRAQGVEQVSVVGLCSGALLGYAAVAAGAPIDHVVSINPRLDSPYAYRWRRLPGPARKLRDLIDLPLTKSPLFPLFDRVPTVVWTLLRRVRIIGNAAALPMAAMRRSTPSLMVLGDKEWGLAALRRRTPKDLETLRRSDQVRLEVVPGLDHSMFNLVARDEVRSLVETELRRFSAGEFAHSTSSTNSGR